jgi:signal transduction histidine kinase
LNQQDGNEYKPSDERLVEKQVIEKVGLISSELAHDLRSPLQTIQNAIYLIERKPDNKELYEIVRQSLQHATEILNNFRDYYKAHILQPLQVELIKVVDLALSEIKIPENIDFKKEIGDIKQITIDPAKMAIVFRKLITNSIEAMPQGGLITLKAHKKPDGINITISDTGKGISPEIANIIYTPFMSGKKHGYGLGIPTAKLIVESHGGDLSFTSKLDEGTVFTIWLPSSTVSL